MKCRTCGEDFHFLDGYTEAWAPAGEEPNRYHNDRWPTDPETGQPILDDEGNPVYIASCYAARDPKWDPEYEAEKV